MSARTSLIDRIFEIYSPRRNRWWTLIVMTVYLVVILSYLFYFKDLSQKDSKISVAKQDFYTVTDKILTQKDSSLIEIENLKHSFNAVDRDHEGVLQEYGFIQVLEDYLVHILSQKTSFDRSKFIKVTAIIQQELDVQPFTQLPPDQRRVLKNLESSINQSDSLTAIYNLSEVNDILRNLNIEKERLEKQNEWSIPLAILGLFITILFGVISVVRPLSYAKLRDVIKKTIKENKNAA